MEISKDAVIKAIGQPDPGDMGLINQLARREVQEDQVYTFALRLCDNDVDREWERFDDGALETLSQMFVGVSGMFDHQWSAKGQTARIYRTQVVSEQGVLTADGRPYRFLKGWAYMARTSENAGLIAEIDAGIKREVSVGCAVSQVMCSICGKELNGCPHEKGQEYEGRLCHGILTGVTDAYEWSFVAVPAQRRAGVIKSAGRQMENEARLGRRYLKGLRREMVRLVGIAEPEMEYALMERVASRLDEGELLGLIKLYQHKADKLLVATPQLSYDETGQSAKLLDGAFLI